MSSHGSALLSCLARCGRAERLQLLRGEVEVAAVPLVQVGRRVVDEHHPDVGGAVDVEVHAGDPGGLAGEEEVLGVGPAAGLQPHQAAPADPDAGDHHRVGRRVDGRVRLGVPPRHVVRAGAGPPPGRGPADAVRPRVAQHAVQLLHAPAATAARSGR